VDGCAATVDDLQHSFRALSSIRRCRAAMAAELRFLTLADVAEVLNISTSQVYALVRNNELEAIKIGGRGQWRVERDRLEEYITRMYEQTREFIAQHPFVEAENTAD
jgi:excisionase family DNA binding protein